MLLGIEFVLALGAIALGIFLFIIGMRRQRAAASIRVADPSEDSVISTNFFALGIIALLFFGGAFLIDVFS